MITQELKDYINTAMNSGIDSVELKKTLLASGWSETEVSEGLESYSPAAPVPANPKKFSWKLVSIISGVVVVFLAAGGVSAYFYVQSRPETVLAKMVQAVPVVNSFNYTGVVEGEVTTTRSVLSLTNLLPGSKQIVSQPQKNIAGAENNKFRLDFTGTAQVSDLNQPDAQFSFTLSVANFIIGAETRAVKQDLYARLTQLTGAPAEFGSYIDKIKNVWIKISKEELAKYADKKDNSDLTVEQKRRIQELWEKSKIFSISKNLGTDTINGVSTYHYEYAIDNQAVQDFIVSVTQIVASPGDDELKIIREMLKSYSFQSGEIWIGKKDHLPYKISYGLNVANNTSDSSLFAGAKITGNLQLSDYNKPVNVQVPENTKSIDELTKEIMTP